MDNEDDEFNKYSKMDKPQLMAEFKRLRQKKAWLLRRLKGQTEYEFLADNQEDLEDVEYELKSITAFIETAQAYIADADTNAIDIATEPNSEKSEKEEAVGLKKSWEHGKLAERLKKIAKEEGWKKGETIASSKIQKIARRFETEGYSFNPESVRSKVRKLGYYSEQKGKKE